VLGASGFLGENFVRWLRSKNEDVFCPGRAELTNLAGDLGHTLYCIGTDDFANNPLGVAEAHVGLLEKILRCCCFASLTYFSSTRLYLGANSSAEDSPIYIDPKDSGRLYNATKIAGEMLCLAIDRPEVRIVRISNVVGFAPRAISFVPMLIKDSLSKGQMHLAIDSTSSKDYIILQDVLELIPAIAATGQHRLYNLGSGTNLSAGEIVNCITRATGAKAHWKPNSPILRFPQLSIARVTTEFSFRPTPVLSALPGIIEIYRRH
jgi:nucleoside-diphosphate-sugar epimerase